MPYSSKSQQRYLHAHPGLVDTHEWDQATKRKKGGFRKLPDRVTKSFFGVEHHFGKAAAPAAAVQQRHHKEAAGAGAVAGGAVVANEARALDVIRRHGSSGKGLASEPWKGGRIRDIKGVSDAPAGIRFSQKTHPEGVYNVSSASLMRARQRPVPRAGQEQLRDSIRAKGLDRPISMSIWENGTARITNGHHRAAIAHELGIKKMPVQVTHVKGPHPVPKSLTEGYQSLRRARYRGQLMRAATTLAKGDTMATSAFGVEHLDTGISKAGGSVLGEVGERIAGGFKGFSGGISGAGRAKTLGAAGKKLPSAGRAAGASGFKAGKFVRANAKPLAVGAGVGGAGMYAANRNF